MLLPPQARCTLRRTWFYSEERGYGFEPGAKLKQTSLGITSEKPFYCHIAVPQEGNYKITVTFGPDGTIANSFGGYTDAVRAIAKEKDCALISLIQSACNDRNLCAFQLSFRHFVGINLFHSCGTIQRPGAEYIRIEC
jgi:hypothetical protein